MICPMPPDWAERRVAELWASTTVVRLHQQFSRSMPSTNVSARAHTNASARARNTYAAPDPLSGTARRTPRTTGGGKPSPRATGVSEPSPPTTEPSPSSSSLSRRQQYAKQTTYTSSASPRAPLGGVGLLVEKGLARELRAQLHGEAREDELQLELARWKQRAMDAEIRLSRLAPPAATPAPAPPAPAKTIAPAPAAAPAAPAPRRRQPRPPPRRSCASGRRPGRAQRRRR